MHTTMVFSPSGSTRVTYGHMRCHVADLVQDFDCYDDIYATGDRVSAARQLDLVKSRLCDFLVAWKAPSFCFAALASNSHMTSAHTH